MEHSSSCTKLEVWDWCALNIGNACVAPYINEKNCIYCGCKNEVNTWYYDFMVFLNKMSQFYGDFLEHILHEPGPVKSAIDSLVQFLQTCTSTVLCTCLNKYWLSVKGMLSLILFVNGTYH